MECCGYRDHVEQFARLNTVLLGISTDQIDAQKKFTEKERLNFPLLADGEKRVTRAYGVLNERNGLAARVTFVIDRRGVVRKIYRDVTPGKNPEEVLDWVKENLADERK